MLNFSKFICEQSTVYYRGIVGEYDKSIEKRKHIIWLTKNKEYAEEYSDGEHLLMYKVSVKNPFDFGYRTLQVDVKLSDILDRILNKLNSLYGKKLSKSEANKIYDMIDNFEEKNKSKLNTMKKVWEWWTDIPELSKIIKKMKFDAIIAKEGLHNDVETIGVLDFKKLQKL